MATSTTLAHDDVRLQQLRASLATYESACAYLAADPLGRIGDLDLLRAALALVHENLLDVEWPGGDAGAAEAVAGRKRVGELTARTVGDACRALEARYVHTAVVDGEERRVIDDAFAHDAVVRGYLELANWLDMALDSCLPVDAAAGAPEPTACAIRLLALAQDGACAKATRRYWSAQGLPWARPDAALDEAREYVGTARSIAAWAGLADELGFDFDEVAGGGE